MSQHVPAFLIAYSDSSFTNPHEVVLPGEPRECTGNFTHMGAKYWGFETSRHRATTLDDGEDIYHYNDEACHWIHIGLEQPALIDRITVSTRWFTGNQVAAIAIELIHEHGRREVVARSALAPDSEETFTFSPCAASECLVRCYHEGGIAQICLYGEVTAGKPERKNLLADARISHISNEHYGRPSDAVNGERQVDHMYGWESARTGFGEHALFHLSRPSTVAGIIVDTYLHRLNAPLSCHVFGLQDDGDDLASAWSQRPRWQLRFNDGHTVTPDDLQRYMAEKRFSKEEVDDPSRFDISLSNPHTGPWQPVLAFGRLRPDTWHHFTELENRGPFTHLLYIHYPNGGIHGLNIYS